MKLQRRTQISGEIIEIMSKAEWENWSLMYFNLLGRWGPERSNSGEVGDKAVKLETTKMNLNKYLFVTF